MSVRADSLVGGRTAGNSNVQEFFCTTLYFNCTAEMFGSGSKFSARTTEEYSRLFGKEGVKTHRQNPPPFCRAVGLRDAASLHVASIRLIWSIHGCGGGMSMMMMMMMLE